MWTPVILVLGVLLVPASVRTQERAPGLYSGQDSIVSLNDTSFHDTVSGRQHAWLVEFYASWCGYCRNFAPVFAEFAGEVAAWGDVIRSDLQAMFDGVRKSPIYIACLCQMYHLRIF